MKLRILVLGTMCFVALLSFGQTAPPSSKGVQTLLIDGHKTPELIPDRAAYPIQGQELRLVFESIRAKATSPVGVKPEDLVAMNQAISTASPFQVAQVLPSILSALRQPDEDTQVLAGAALVPISLRLDGADLLRDHIDEIGKMLDSPISRLQNGAVHFWA